MCKTACNRTIFASLKPNHSKTLQVKTYVPNHNCGRVWSNRLVNSSWLCMVYYEDFKIRPAYPVTNLMEAVRKDFNVKVSLSQCYRARRKAWKKIRGTYADQYGKLWDYCGEIVRSNPDTSAYIHFKEDNEGIPTEEFQRMYICWGSLKRGFIEGCRPLVGVDGCHLKGLRGGMLLSAVGLDGNNQIYLLTYALVEKEDAANWSWFLKYLIRGINIPNEPTFTIISDKQKVFS